MTKQILLTMTLLMVFIPFGYSQHKNSANTDSQLNHKELSSCCNSKADLPEDGQVEPQRENKILIGSCTKTELLGPLFGSYFTPQYNSYQPNKNKIDLLKTKINKTQITIVFGSWCGDSRKQVGRFYKILDESGFHTSTLKIIAVNRSLSAGATDIKALNISRVPTFIIYYKGKEIGRIIESPKTSLENDLWKIVSNIN